MAHLWQKRTSFAMLLTSSGSKKAPEKLIPSIAVELNTSFVAIDSWDISDPSDLDSDWVSPEELRIEVSPEGISTSARCLNEGSPNTENIRKYESIDLMIDEIQLTVTEQNNV